MKITELPCCQNSKPTDHSKTAMSLSIKTVIRVVAKIPPESDSTIAIGIKTGAA
jgi:hypothetical protein